MKDLLLKLGIMFFLACCSSAKSEVYFHIQNNNTKAIIENVVVSNGINNKFLPAINPDSEEIIVLKFENVPRTDGGYQIRYTLNSKNYFKAFGYYSNGVPSNSIYYLTIKKDTILIKERRK